MAVPIHPVLAAVTAEIVERSREGRADYLARMAAARDAGYGRGKLSCANWAHAFAGAPTADKLRARGGKAPNVGIVTAYNDMLSAHQPYEHFPEILRSAAREAGATAQVAGGTPAMCDGVTQGREGMELSLFSRDVIALSTGIALSHDAFDAALYLGICDKIVPGLFMGAMAFGFLPTIFVPGGPMPSGIPNAEKARTRALFAEGKIGRDALLESEMASYHSPGTCTFYGTANSNQLMMEAMGLHLPGAAFVHPHTPLRDALTAEAARRAVALADSGEARMAEVVDEKAIVNAVVTLLATGGSTNHTLHLIAMARVGGISLNWDDFDRLSATTPLLTRIYPNGEGDVNHFQAAGGMGFVIRELLDAGLMHEDVTTILGRGLRPHSREPFLIDGRLDWRDPPATSGDDTILRPASNPFSAEGGLRLLKGNAGRAVIKISAVKPEHRAVEAPALVFEDQESFLKAFHEGRLDRDFVAVVRFQGPRANGMPELHNLSPALSVLQDRGRKVALVTDGRMSGASGKTPAAIHLTPEAEEGGPIGRIRDGDLIHLDAEAGVLEVRIDPAEFARRDQARKDLRVQGFGRELFGGFRKLVEPAERGAGVIFA